MNSDAYHSWNYYITDYLGSTRKVVTDANTIKETINYYPYGSEMRLTDPALIASNTFKERFRFSGKELDWQDGLNMYDFGARMFDVAGVPVWTSMDPLAENNVHITPYSYCNGDPVNRFDPDGRDDYYTRQGDYLGSNKDKTDYIYIADEGHYRKLEDGRYAIDKMSRTTLSETELDAESYSKIFTNSLVLGGFNKEDLADHKIQVTIWQREGGSKITKDYTDKSDNRGDALASTDREKSTGAIITVYIWPIGTEERYIYDTRSNIINLLEDHEFKGHFRNGFIHNINVPDSTYKMQKDSPYWKKTTSQFKNYINKTIKGNGYE